MRAAVTAIVHCKSYERKSTEEQDLEKVFRHLFDTVYGVCPVDPYEASGSYPFANKVGLTGFVDNYKQISLLRYGHHERQTTVPPVKYYLRDNNKGNYFPWSDDDVILW